MISVGLRILTICELLKQVSIEAFEEEHILCLFFRSFQNEPILRDRFHTLNITIFQVYSVIHLRYKTFLPTVQFHKFPIPIFSIVIMIIIVINALRALYNISLAGGTSYSRDPSEKYGVELRCRFYCFFPNNPSKSRIKIKVSNCNVLKTIVLASFYRICGWPEIQLSYRLHSKSALLWSSSHWGKGCPTWPFLQFLWTFSGFFL